MILGPLLSGLSELPRFLEIFIRIKRTTLKIFGKSEWIHFFLKKIAYDRWFICILIILSLFFGLPAFHGLDCGSYVLCETNFRYHSYNRNQHSQAAGMFRKFLEQRKAWKGNLHPEVVHIAWFNRELTVLVCWMWNETWVEIVERPESARLDTLMSFEFAHKIILVAWNNE